MIINGEPHENIQADTLQAILDYFKLSEKRVAIELNGKIIDKGTDPRTVPVNKNDVIELIHFAGGG